MPHHPRSHNPRSPRQNHGIVPTTRHFAQIGRLPPGGGTLSRGLILIAAIGVFAALIALIWDIRHVPLRPSVVEVSFMEDEAAQAEAAMDAQATTTAPSENPQQGAN